MLVDDGDVRVVAADWRLGAAFLRPGETGSW